MDMWLLSYCQRNGCRNIHAQLCYTIACHNYPCPLWFQSSASQVTVKLVEEYIKPEEMVILCVIPAMSDFGNAEAAGCGSV